MEVGKHCLQLQLRTWPEEALEFMQWSESRGGWGTEKRIATRSEPCVQIIWANQMTASLLQVVVALEPYLELVTWEAPAVDWYPCQYSFCHSSKVSAMWIPREDNPQSVEYPLVRNKYLPSAYTTPLSPRTFEARDEDKGSLIFWGFEWCKCWHNWPCKLAIPTTRLDFRMWQIRLQVSRPGHISISRYHARSPRCLEGSVPAYPVCLICLSPFQRLLVCSEKILNTW